MAMSKSKMLRKKRQAKWKNSGLYGAVCLTTSELKHRRNSGIPLAKNNLPDGSVDAVDTSKKKKRRENRKTNRSVSARGRNIPYSEYLRSSHWQRKRLQKLHKERFRCERCSGKATQVHHRHYRSLWHEKMADLEAICGMCHKREHETLIAANSHLDSIARQI